MKQKSAVRADLRENMWTLPVAVAVIVSMVIRHVMIPEKVKPLALSQVTWYFSLTCFWCMGTARLSIHVVYIYLA